MSFTTFCLHCFYYMMLREHHGFLLKNINKLSQTKLYLQHWPSDAEGDDRFQQVAVKTHVAATTAAVKISVKKISAPRKHGASCVLVRVPALLRDPEVTAVSTRRASRETVTERRLGRRRGFGRESDNERRSCPEGGSPSGASVCCCGARS